MASVIRYLHFKLPSSGGLIRVFLSLCVVSLFFAPPGVAMSSMTNPAPLSDEKWQPPPILAWNITGTYQGSWSLMDSKNSHSRSRKIKKSSGDFVLELISTPTRVNGVHSVKGMIIFRDLFDNNEHEVGSMEVKVEGVYIWPYRKLRVVAYRGEAGEFGQEEDCILSNPYHTLGVFTSQVFEESLWDKIRKRKHSTLDDMKKHCSMEIAGHVSLVPPTKSNGLRYHIEGSMESFSVDDDGDCLQPMLLSSTSINTDMYFIKVLNYNLMVTLISFLQVLLLLQQIKHSSTQFAVARVSIVAIGQQTLMDAYLCAIHLVAAFTVDSLFNAFASTAFSMFVVFYYFEMKYFEAIWKANRLTTVGGRRELAVIFSLLCGIFLGGILVMYKFQKFLPIILLLLHSFWVPQIVTNVVRDRRKVLHPYYIIGMSITRLVVPLYFCGCPHNFMHTKPDKKWCISLVVIVGLQALILLLQHFVGSGCAIFWKIFRIKYNYSKRSDQDMEDATDCVICLAAIDFSEPPIFCMVTPCGHFYHSNCLRKWMDENMVCPICRSQLPPF